MRDLYPLFKLQTRHTRQTRPQCRAPDANHHAGSGACNSRGARNKTRLRYGHVSGPTHPTLNTPTLQHSRATAQRNPTYDIPTRETQQTQAL
eukprot:scaffold185655_cov40-Tisochrysis_lutea.AAC.3